MIDHNTRILGLVKATLKRHAIGQPCGCAIGHGFVLVGNGVALGWTITVTMPNPMIGEPEIGSSVSVPGLLPVDQAFEDITVHLLGECRKQADEKTAMPVEAQAQAEPGKGGLIIGR